MTVVVLHSIIASVWSRSRVVRRAFLSILCGRLIRKETGPKSLNHTRCLFKPFSIPGTTRFGAKIERNSITNVILPTFKDSGMHNGGEYVVAIFDKITSPV